MIIYDLPPPILSAFPRPHLLMLQAATVLEKTCTHAPVHTQMPNTVTCAHMHSWKLCSSKQAHTLSHFFPTSHSFQLKATYLRHSLLSSHLHYHTANSRSGYTQLAKLSLSSVLFSEKQRHQPIRCFENQMLPFSCSPLCIKWHMADESLWCLSLSPCIIFFIVPNFQQLDLINPGKTQRAQGSLNN